MGLTQIIMIDQFTSQKKGKLFNYQKADDKIFACKFSKNVKSKLHHIQIIKIDQFTGQKVLTLKLPESRQQKFSSANFQKMLSPSYIIFRIQRLEVKQCRSRWGGSSWATLSRATLLANSAIFVSGTQRINVEIQCTFSPANSQVLSVTQDILWFIREVYRLSMELSGQPPPLDWCFNKCKQALPKCFLILFRILLLENKLAQTLGNT